MSATKTRALAELGPRYGLAGSGGEVAAGSLGAWSSGRPLLLDVGVGRGEATVAWAEGRPDAAILAVELHRPGLASTLMAVDDAVRDGRLAADSVRVLDRDVRQVLDVLLDGHGDGEADGDVAGVRVLFPDPWPKRRHRNRRLVDAVFVASVGDALVTDGILHVATDHGPYAEQVIAALRADGRFAVDAEVPRPPRPVTAYEHMARDAGRRVIEVVGTRL